MKPVARALRSLGCEPMLVFTGQHAGLAPAAFGLADFPRIELALPGTADPHRHVRAVTREVRRSLRGADLVVVQGDTSSALGAALAGFAERVPVAHVEAGLRTHDPRLPWPEEEYRIAIDAHADLLFAPTALAAANLRAEKVSGQIHVTGNTAIDAALEVEARLPAPALRERSTPSILVTCHRRESWGDGLDGIAGALRHLASDGVLVDFVLHPNAFVAKNMRSVLEGQANIRLIGPCRHDELIRRMHVADLLLSDSGGIQEEAPTYGIPLLVLREKTERPEGVMSGNAILVGTDPERIIGETRRLLADPVARNAMSRRSMPFGDGRSGARIAAIICEWLEQRSLTSSLG